MPTQEERIAALEQTTSEYRPVLQNFAYELSMVKGLIVTQTEITQELRRDMNEVKKRLNQLEAQSDEHTAILKEHTAILSKQTNLLAQILERLPQKP